MNLDEIKEEKVVSSKVSPYEKLKEIRNNITIAREKYLTTEENNEKELDKLEAEEIIYLSKNRELLTPNERVRGLGWVKVYAVVSFLLSVMMVFAFSDILLDDGFNSAGLIGYSAIMLILSYFTFKGGRIAKFTMVVSTVLSLNYLMYIINLVYLSIEWRNPLFKVSQKELKSIKEKINTDTYHNRGG
tara:strand:+ start:2884 stop:3447 length:564 start_codon:yes stop_codon:yes gene_type:complete